MRNLVIVAALGLSGCMLNTQPGQGEAFLPASEIAAKDDAICQGYGAKPGSPEYINCRGIPCVLKCLAADRDIWAYSRATKPSFSAAKLRICSPHTAGSSSPSI
jgi:hypothetical protein